jgi:WD40 repeat protein
LRGDVPGRGTPWDGAARARLGVLDGTTSDPTTDATGAVTALAFSHDGRTLAVAGSPGSLHLWDLVLASQRLLGTALPTRATRSTHSRSAPTARSTPPAPTSPCSGTTCIRTL